MDLSPAIGVGGRTRAHFSDSTTTRTHRAPSLDGDGHFDSALVINSDCDAAESQRTNDGFFLGHESVNGRLGGGKMRPISVHSPLAAHGFRRSLNETARLLAKYNPAKCLTPVPYLNRLQMAFLAALESLMAAVSTMVSSKDHVSVLGFGGVSNVVNGESRALVTSVADRTLNFLHRFCLESFSAERLLLSNAIRAATATQSQNQDQGQNTTSDVVKKLRAESASQDEVHSSFLDRVAVWKERIDHNDLCAGSIAIGMATFAAEHFQQDNAMCQLAAPFLGGEEAMRNMTHRSSFLPVRTTHVDAAAGEAEN